MKFLFFLCCVLFLKPLSPFLQVLGESLYISGKYLYYEEKYVMAKSKVESLSAKNESLKSQISAFADEAKKDKDHLKTLEKSIDTKKAFSKLMDKQINEALQKVEKPSSEAVEKFKISYEYSDKMYDYYVEGFKLCRKYLAKHHPGLDFSNLDMEAVKEEVLVDCQSAEGVGEGGEVATIDKAINVDLSSYALP